MVRYRAAFFPPSLALLRAHQHSAQLVLNAPWRAFPNEALLDLRRLGFRTDLVDVTVMCEATLFHQAGTCQAVHDAWHEYDAMFDSDDAALAVRRNDVCGRGWHAHNSSTRIMRMLCLRHSGYAQFPLTLTSTRRDADAMRYLRPNADSRHDGAMHALRRRALVRDGEVPEALVGAYLHFGNPPPLGVQLRAWCTAARFGNPPPLVFSGSVCLAGTAEPTSSFVPSCSTGWTFTSVACVTSGALAPRLFQLSPPIKTRIRQNGILSNPVKHTICVFRPACRIPPGRFGIDAFMLQESHVSAMCEESHSFRRHAPCCCNYKPSSHRHLGLSRSAVGFDPHCWLPGHMLVLWVCFAEVMVGAAVRVQVVSPSTARPAREGTELLVASCSTGSCAIGMVQRHHEVWGALGGQPR